MAMQVGLDELMSMLLARMDALSMEDENMKSRFNIVARVLHKKGLITDQDIIDSVKDEHRLLKEIGMIDKEPPQEAIEAVAKGILLWIKCDSSAIKKSMEEYEKRVKEAMEKQQKTKLEVAPASTLQQLNKKIIL